MKLNRSKNAGKNMVMELIVNLFNMFMPFILRTAMIQYLGMQYIGLGGLFTSVLNVLNLTELGVGAAMVFSMYKPIADDNSEKICALMNLYKKYYRIIGAVILLGAIIVSPFIKYLIKGSYPEDINLQIVFFMNVTVTVLTCWCFSYKNCILQAHQKVYIATKINFKYTVIFSVLQLISLFFFKNYYIYLGLNIFRQIFSNIGVAKAAKKNYPQYNPKGTLDKKEERKIQKKIKDLFIAKLGSTVINSADTIVISSFLGLTILAKYQNYFFIMSSVLVLVGVVYNATRAGIGNSFECESIEKNLEDLDIFTFIIWIVITICSSCLLGLFQPFMVLWVGRQNLLEFGIVLCISIMFITRYYKQLLMTYKDAVGIWHQDRFRPLIAGIVNLLMNIVMVQYWGLYGVTLSTIISEIIIEIPWLVWNLFHTVFQCSPKKYIIKTIKLVIVSVFTIVISYLIVRLFPIDGIQYFFIRGFLSFMIPCIVLFLLFHNSKERVLVLGIAKKMIHK